MARFGFCAASSLILEFEYTFFYYRNFVVLLKKEIKIFEKKCGFKDMELLL